MLTKDDVLKISKLANLSLSEEELERFTKQISEVVSYMDKLQKIDVSGVQPTSHAIEKTKNRFKNDSAYTGLTIDEALKNASRKNDRYFVTKAVL